MRFPSDVCLVVKMTQEYTGIEKANLVLGSSMLVDWCAFVSSTGEQLKGGD